MSRPTELAELHGLIDALHRSVASLKSKYGDSLPMRRIVNDAERLRNDIERLDIDVHEWELGTGLRTSAAGEKIAIPDTQYDRDFWGDISDGGVGG